MRTCWLQNTQSLNRVVLWSLQIPSLPTRQVNKWLGFDFGLKHDRLELHAVMCVELVGTGVLLVIIIRHSEDIGDSIPTSV